MRESEVLHKAGQPTHCLGVLPQVQHKLLAWASALNVSEIAVLPPEFMGKVGQGSLVASRIEPARKPPSGYYAAPRLRQGEPFVKSGEYSRSGRCHGVVQVQPTGRRVERVPWVAVPTEVTVISRPIESLIVPYLIDFADPFNLEPAPQHVKLRCAPDKAPTGRSPLHSPEEAEKQEHIPRPHALICQMCL